MHNQVNNAQPKVVISILSWNSGIDLIECLSSVFKSNYSNYSVVLVDNGSTDQTIPMVRTLYPDIKIIENANNLGYAEGNNIGMIHALGVGADYVWLLNDDAIVATDALSKLVTSAEFNPKIGMVSPVIYTHDDEDRIQFCGSYVDFSVVKYIGTSNLEEIEAWQSESIKQICLWGTALLIRKELIKSIGMLDTRFFAYFEDTDYSVRSFKAGYVNWVETSATIWHKNSTLQIKRPPHYHYLFTRNEYLFWRKHLSNANRIRMLRIYLSNVLMLAAKLRDNQLNESLEACLSGFWDALHGVWGAPNLSRKMPGFIKSIFLWHPYFISNILNRK